MVTYISKEIAKEVASEKLSRLEDFFKKCNCSDRMMVKKYRHWIFGHTKKIIDNLRSAVLNEELKEFLRNLQKLEKCKADKTWATELIKSGVTVDYSLPIRV